MSLKTRAAVAKQCSNETFCVIVSDREKEESGDVPSSHQGRYKESSDCSQAIPTQLLLACSQSPCLFWAILDFAELPPIETTATSP